MKNPKKPKKKIINLDDMVEVKLVSPESKLCVHCPSLSVHRVRE